MANKIKGLTIEIAGETQLLTKSLGEVNKHTRDLKSELRDVERLLKLNPSDTTLLAQKQKILAESIENTKNKLDTLKEAERQAQEQFAKGDIAEDQYRAIQREVIKTEEELKKMNKQLKEMDWKGITDNLDKFGKKSEKIGKDLTKKVTAPILGIGVAATKIGMDFEQSMSKVEAMSGATAEEMEKLESAAREAGATTSKSAKDSADALSYMALAGWDVDDSVKGLLPVLHLAEAGNIDLAKASSLVTDSMSATGTAIEDLDRYLDIIAQTARNSNTDIDQMAEAYIEVGSTLRGLKIPLEDSSVALGMMANAGIKGGEAGRALNAVLINMTAPAGKAKTALEELGLSAFDSEGEFIGLDNVLFDLKDRLGDLTEEQQNMYLAMIGGKSHVSDLNALLNGLDDSYEELSGSIENADGALLEIRDTMVDNAKGGLVELGSALEELALKIYDVIAPAVASLIDGVKGLIDWLNNLSPEMQQTIVIIAGLAAAIGPVLIVVGKMSLGLSALIKLFAPMTTGLITATGATGGLSAAIAFITGPIGIAIAAIAAITAVIVTLWKTNEEFRENVREIWEQIKEIFNLALNFIKELITTIVIGITAFWEEHGEKIKTITNTVWNAISTIINTILGVISGLINTFIGLITGDWEAFTNGLKTIWQSMWEGIKTIVEGAWNLLKSAFSSLYNSISGWFTGLVSDAFNWGKNMISGFIDGIKSMASAVGRAVSNVVGGVKDFLGFRSSAKKGEGRYIVDWGKNMIGGFIEGMEKAMPELQMSARSIMPVVKNEIINTTKIDYNKIPKGDTIIYVNNPQPSPSELARQIKKQQQELALGF